MKTSYKESGVDIEAGAKLVERIKPFVKETFDSRVIGGIGGFAGAYELPQGYKRPVLLGATDGVGTKLKLAIEAKRLDTVGVDLVAMCVNDLICSFAEPLFFLDYYATGRLNVQEAGEVIKGIARGCKEAECALIGGETAEMPGMYSGNDFDLAGFAVGIAEKEELLRESEVKAGDLLVALESSGIHSNGYSLVRKVLFEKQNLGFEYEVGGRALIEVLLEPTKIYVKTFKKVREKIKALAHITGGGIVENLPRSLPQGCKAIIEKNRIKPQPIFDLLSRYVEEDEMFRTFNMGVGMIMVVSKENAEEVAKVANGYVIGEIVKGDRGVEIV